MIVLKYYGMREKKRVRMKEKQLLGQSVRDYGNSFSTA